MKVQEDCITDEEEKQDVTGFGDRNRDDTDDNRLLTLRSQAQTTTKAQNSNTVYTEPWSIVMWKRL